MLYTKEIFDVLSRGGFISRNSVNVTRTRIYDDIEENYDDYLHYFEGIGFVLEGGNGYYYFTRTEARVDLIEKLSRFALWIDRIDFLKVYNSTFGEGFTFRKASIMVQMDNDVELKEKAVELYPDTQKLEDKVDRLVSDLDKQGYIELENELDGTYRVTSAFNYIEEMIECITIVENSDEEAS